MGVFNGQNLKLARLYNGLTINELANKINISPQAESQYELGKIIPQFDNLIKLSDALNFPPSFFFSKINELCKNRVIIFSFFNENVKKI